MVTQDQVPGTSGTSGSQDLQALRNFRYSGTSGADGDSGSSGPQGNSGIRNSGSSELRYFRSGTSGLQVSLQEHSRFFRHGTSGSSGTSGVINVTNPGIRRVMTDIDGDSARANTNLTFNETGSPEGDGLLNVIGDVIITRDLTVQGTASFQNSENLLIKDRFILMASGSTGRRRWWYCNTTRNTRYR